MVAVQKTAAVSVVIPVYNVDEYLEDCIKSVVSQSYKNLEVIVVNDGSTDRSGDICREYAEKDSRIRYVVQENSGVSIARNAALNIATGDYVTFVDADDAIRSNAIEDMVGMIQSANVDCVRTRCEVRKGDVSSQLPEDVERGLYTGDRIQELTILAATGNLMCFTWLLLVKREVLVNNRLEFPVGVLMMEDMWFYIDLLNAIDSIFISDEITYNYFVRDTGATRSFNNFDAKINSIVEVNGHVTSQKFDRNQVRYINAVHASNIVNFTVINAMRISRISESKKLLKDICQNKNFLNIYAQADMARVVMYHRLACWAAANNNILILRLIVMLRKAVSR